MIERVTSRVTKWVIHIRYRKNKGVKLPIKGDTVTRCCKNEKKEHIVFQKTNYNSISSKSKKPFTKPCDPYIGKDDSSKKQLRLKGNEVTKSNNQISPRKYRNTQVCSSTLRESVTP